MKRIDAVASLIIGGMAALLMFAVSRSVSLPAVARPYLAPALVSFPLATLGTIAVGSFLGRRAQVFYQFTKYALVGGLNFLLDLGVLNLLIHVTTISQGAYANALKARTWWAGLMTGREPVGRGSKRARSSMNFATTELSMLGHA